MNNYEAFVYVWEDITILEESKQLKYYIGSHKGKDNDGYIATQKEGFEKAYAENPQNFVRTIVEYGTEKDMRMLESKMQIDVDAARNSQYYNKSNSNGKFFNDGSPEICRKISEGVGAGEDNFHFGTKHSVERRQKTAKSQAKFLNSLTDEEKSEKWGQPGELNGMYGKTHTPEVCAAISERTSGENNYFYGTDQKGEKNGHWKGGLCNDMKAYHRRWKLAKKFPKYKGIDLSSMFDIV